MTDKAAIERSLRLPPSDEREYGAPGLRPAAALGRTADPAWRARRDRPRAVAILAVAVVATALLLAGIVVVGGLTTTRPEPTLPGLEAAAQALGVDESAVVETADGVVAARARGAVVELAVATPTDAGWTVRVIASFVEPPDFGGSAAFDVSCDASFGLRQPNFAYGDAHEDPSRPPATMLITGIEGSGSSYGHGPWVVAFAGDAPIRDQSYQIVADRGSQYQRQEVGGGSFKDPQACGTTEDLRQPADASPTPPVPAGSAVLLLETGATFYGPTGSTGLGRVVIENERGDAVFDEVFTQAVERRVELPAGVYAITVTGGLNDCAGSVALDAGVTTAVSVEWFAGGCRVTVEPGSSGASDGVLRLSPMRVGIPQPTAGVVVAPAGDASHLFVQVVASGGGVVFDGELSESQALTLQPGDYSIRAWQALVIDDLETGVRTIGLPMDPCSGRVTLTTGQTLDATVEKQPNGAGCRVLAG